MKVPCGRMCTANKAPERCFSNRCEHHAEVPKRKIILLLASVESEKLDVHRSVFEILRGKI